MQYPSIEIFFFIAMASEKKIEFFSGKSRYFIGFNYIGAIGIENNPSFNIITQKYSFDKVVFTPRKRPISAK